MKKIILLILLLAIFSCQFEKKNIEDDITEKHHILKEDNFEEVIEIMIDFPGGFKVVFIRKPFISEEHNINLSSNKIDGLDIFGADGKIPRYKLEAYAQLETKIPLETTGMYNPWEGDENLDSKIRVITINGETIIFGTFSNDGGQYAAEWRINDNTSERLELSNSPDFLTKYKIE